MGRPEKPPGKKGKQKGTEKENTLPKLNTMKYTSRITSQEDLPICDLSTEQTPMFVGTAQLPAQRRFQKKKKTTISN